MGVNKNTIYYSSTEDNSIERVIYSISLDGKSKKAISPKKGFNGASFSSNYKYFIHTFEDSSTPMIYSLRESKSGKLIRRIMDNDVLKNLEPYSLSPKEFSEVDINDEKLNMWMIKSTNFNPEKNIHC